MTAAATASNGGGGGGRVAAWIGSLGGRSGGSFNGSLSRAASGVSERSRSESGKPPRGELAAAFDGAAAFFRRNNLPLLFLVAMAVALAAPAPGRAVLKPQVRRVCVCMCVCWRVRMHRLLCRAIVCCARAAAPATTQFQH